MDLAARQKARQAKGAENGAGMDHTFAAVLTETIKKEIKHRDRVAKLEHRGEKSTVTAGAMLTKKKSSCQLNQLDQNLCAKSNPHLLPSSEQKKVDPQELLRYGVSYEGQGKKAYLKLQTRDKGPAERYGRQVTAAQEVGWVAHAACQSYVSSPFAHRPLIQSEFYRTMGASSGALTSGLI